MEYNFLKRFIKIINAINEIEFKEEIFKDFINECKLMGVYNNLLLNVIVDDDISEDLESNISIDMVIEFNQVIKTSDINVFLLIKFAQDFMNYERSQKLNNYAYMYDLDDRSSDAAIEGLSKILTQNKGETTF